MKLIIAGSRNLSPPIEFIGGLVNDSIKDIIEVVDGGACGVDFAGRNWAKSHGIPIKSMPADWDTHGKAAGPIRNKQMAEYGDALLLIWDGESKGSKSMKSEMLKLNKPVCEIIVNYYNFDKMWNV